jgi:hypothetical protein
MNVKRVKFERTGGFANIRFAADFGLDELPDDLARELTDLLDELDFDELPEHLMASEGAPDGFTYSITVESDEWTHSVTTADSSAPDEMHPLFDLLVKIARQQMKKSG